MIFFAAQCYNCVRLKCRPIIKVYFDERSVYKCLIPVKISRICFVQLGNIPNCGQKYFSRMASSSFFSRRDTCTCVMPSAAAISVCVLP